MKAKFSQAWGWAAASAKFRGVLNFILLGIILLLLLLQVYHARELSRRTWLVVSAPNGEAQVMNVTSEFDPLLFAREVASRLYSYDRLSIRDNNAWIIRLASPEFLDSYKNRFSDSFAEAVIARRGTQLFIPAGGELVEITPTEVTVDVAGTQYRGGEDPKQTKYRLSFYRSRPVETNPWGYVLIGASESEQN